MLRLKLLDRELYESDLVPRRLGAAGDAMRPKYDGDAGIDLRARETMRVHAGETKAVPLGVAVEVPNGCVGWVSGRSTTSLAMGLFVHEGKIDAGYTGEIHCFVTAQGAPADIARGDRLCQLVTVVIERPEWLVVDELKPSKRGEHGLGSTGRR